MTTRLTDGLNWVYKPTLPASAYAALFHVVQASLLLTRHSPLKETIVLLATIPKGIFIFFHTQESNLYHEEAGQKLASK